MNQTHTNKCLSEQHLNLWRYTVYVLCMICRNTTRTVLVRTGGNAEGICQLRAGCTIRVVIVDLYVQILQFVSEAYMTQKHVMMQLFCKIGTF